MFEPLCIIKTESGDELVVLSRRQFDDLCRGKETSDDIEDLIHDRMCGGEVWLAAARKERGWSQSRLARESGISQSYISQLENQFHQGKPSCEVVGALARAIGVTPAHGCWG
jgi:ribosome-binding protein aMBF1 (putative translation factor)